MATRKSSTEKGVAVAEVERKVWRWREEEEGEGGEYEQYGEYED